MAAGAKFETTGTTLSAIAKFANVIAAVLAAIAAIYAVAESTIEGSVIQDTSAQLLLNWFGMGSTQWLLRRKYSS